MSEQQNYSDEYINAYIDGELDSDERTRLLFDEQTNPTLAKRINEKRMLKEKVQLAYMGFSNSNDEKKPGMCAGFVNRHRAMAVGLVLLAFVSVLLAYHVTNIHNLEMAKRLIKNTPAIPAYSISTAVGANEQVVINVSRYQPSDFSQSINKIEALLEQHRGDKAFRLEIVANGQGLKALDADTSLHAGEIHLLAQHFDNLKIVACAKSLAKLAAQGDAIKLLQGIMLTPSAAEQVAKRTGEGWLYIKI